MNAVYNKGPLYSCLLEDNDLTQSSSPATPPHLFQPQAEDILTDEHLLDLFRIVKQVLRKKPDANKLAKLLFCVSYALGDHVKFFKPLHEDRILFRNDDAFSTSSSVHVVRLPQNSSCCSSNIRPMDSPPSSSSPSTANGVAGDTLTHTPLSDFTNNNHDSGQKWHDMTVSIPSPSSSTTSRSPLTKLLPVPFLDHQQQHHHLLLHHNQPHLFPLNLLINNLLHFQFHPITSTDAYSVRFTQTCTLPSLQQHPYHHHPPPHPYHHQRYPTSLPNLDVHFIDPHYHYHLLLLLLHMLKS
ncbi:unnamed protein product [Absidia cylindrospora]